MPEENNNSENPKPEENSDSSIGNEIENKIENDFAKNLFPLIQEYKQKLETCEDNLHRALADYQNLEKRSHPEVQQKVLEKTNLENIFEEMVNGYNLQVYKPTPYIYQEAQYEFEIDDRDKVYYFEDLKENLKISKDLYNWITALIDPESDDSKEEYIDFFFKSGVFF